MNSITPRGNTDGASPRGNISRSIAGGAPQYLPGWETETPGRLPIARLILGDLLRYSATTASGTGRVGRSGALSACPTP